MSGVFNANPFSIVPMGSITTNSTTYQYPPQQVQQLLYYHETPIVVLPPVNKWDEIEKAHARAMELLESNLNVGQLAHLREDRSFYVRGGVSGVLYRVFLDTRVWCPSRRTWYCIIQDSSSMGRQFEHRAPVPDIALTKKLLIECDEENFLRIACAEEGGRLDNHRQW